MTHDTPSPSNEFVNVPRDSAIEFGEYLAKAAERYQLSMRIYAKADITNDAELDFTELNEAYRTLSSAIYEFRKRVASKAKAPTSPSVNAGLMEKLTARWKVCRDASVDSDIPMHARTAFWNRAGGLKEAIDAIAAASLPDPQTATSPSPFAPPPSKPVP